MFRTGTGHIGERQTETLEIAKRAAGEQRGQIVVRRTRGQREFLRSALLLQSSQRDLPSADLRVHLQAGRCRFQRRDQL